MTKVERTTSDLLSSERERCAVKQKAERVLCGEGNLLVVLSKRGRRRFGYERDEPIGPTVGGERSVRRRESIDVLSACDEVSRQEQNRSSRTHARKAVSSDRGQLFAILMDYIH